MIYTDEQRMHLAINMLCSMRENTMGRKEEVIGNLESVLTILVASDSFLDKSRLDKELSSLKYKRSKQDIWDIIKSDIKRMFPGQFTLEELGEKL
jgi:hypothetical protein